MNTFLFSPRYVFDPRSTPSSGRFCGAGAILKLYHLIVATRLKRISGRWKKLASSSVPRRRRFPRTNSLRVLLSHCGNAFVGRLIFFCKLSILLRRKEVDDDHSPCQWIQDRRSFFYRIQEFGGALMEFSLPPLLDRTHDNLNGCPFFFAQLRECIRDGIEGIALELLVHLEDGDVPFGWEERACGHDRLLREDVVILDFIEDGIGVERGNLLF